LYTARRSREQRLQIIVDNINNADEKGTPMTANEIRELYAYNAWANNRIFDIIETLPAEQYMQDMKSSLGSIHGTLVHLVGAEKVWLERWQKAPNVVFLKANEIYSFAELRNIWNIVQENREKFIAPFTDDMLNNAVSVTDSRGGVLVNTYSQMMQHLINHSTFHRGQVVTMLRQLGATPVGTDLITYFRQK
jgi:uncharacterized damage-inducible protein DinB